MTFDIGKPIIKKRADRQRASRRARFSCDLQSVN
jgi:hypothetical protein